VRTTADDVSGGGGRPANPIANRGYGLMVLTAAIWSSNAIIGRGLHEVVPPIGLTFWRFLPAVPIFLALARPHLARDVPLALRRWPTMLALSVFSICLYNSCIYVGLDHTTAVNMVLINTARPVIIVLMSLVFFRVPVTGAQVVGLVLGLLGTAVLVFRGDLQAVLGLQLNVGDLWILAGSTSWALYTVFLHKQPAVHPASFLAMTTTIGVTILLPFYLWETVTTEAVPLVPATVGAAAYLAVFASVISYLAYNRAVAILGANRAALVSYLIPVFGVGLAIALLGESFHAYHAVGIALLLAGTTLAGRRKA
jgi:drug/metabolite transporter (DMT)-like permease